MINELFLATHWSPRHWMTLIGLLVMAMPHVRWGRAHVHPFVIYINEVVFFATVPVREILASRGSLRLLLDRPLPVPDNLKAEAAWWTVERLTYGHPLGTPQTTSR
jgi:hypothetical protein